MTVAVGTNEDTFLDFLLNDDPYNSERIGGPVKPWCIVIVYLIFVKFLGPIIMEDIRAFKLKTAMIVYNFSLVLVNVYIAFNVFRVLFEGFINIGPCAWGHKDQYTREYTIKSFKYVWLYYLSKYIDLLDTIFFVLRKKQNQITFLHIFHHTLMILMVWYTLHIRGTGAGIPLAVGINAVVHVIMYGYYGLTACGPDMQKFVRPYKKYLTLSQLMQFLILEIFALICSRNPEFFRVVWMLFIAALIVLFTDFYIKAYSTTKGKKILKN